jgi:energy-coupling factor transporter transmembrane protein EcfT
VTEARWLALALTAVAAAALAPAGLRGSAVPAWSVAVWASALAVGLAAFAGTGRTVAQLARRVAWLLPFVAALSLPAALFAPTGRRAVVALALAARAIAATTAVAGTVMRLGPPGLVRGVRGLGVPDRLVDVLEASLVSLEAIVGQARAMLRAREARRSVPGPWGSLLREPVATLTGFGRFAGALLLRTIERAEAVERARRARGADLW